MIRIGMFSEPMNSEIPQYAGIYRLNNICDYEDISREVGKSINFINEKWEGEILLFGDEKIRVDTSEFVFIGCDIGADSMHYSPLGDGFLIKYDRDANVFDSELSLSDFLKYKNNINRQGLFSSHEIACDFAQYCNYINMKHSHAVESEDI